MAYFDQSDVEKNRVLGGLGYLIFFLPFITCPDSRFGKACANQGLIALMELILGWIPVVNWIVGIAGTVCNIGFAILWLYYGILAFSKGDFRPLPYIGSYELIK